MNKRSVMVQILVIALILLWVSALKPVGATGDSWLTKAPMPVARRDLGVAAVDNKIYAIGGLPFSNITEQYDPVTDKWTTKSPMPIVRSSFSVAVPKQNLCLRGANPERPK